ncbi:hypothetical protein C8J56DRAFT_89661 [Mycena floridula]|nr:hypothetical protein C8J56DRAFT_89661 [Mycena floridula]
MTTTASDDLPPRNTNHGDSKQSRSWILRIISYSHRRGPLQPAPDLQFDVRALRNPPKNVRDKYNGNAKALREWFLSDETVKRRFEEVCEAIGKALEAETAEKPSEQPVSDSVSEDLEKREAKNFVVGICCEMGRHRSVAFVEELGCRKWPVDWDVNIHHRDISGRGKSKQEKAQAWIQGTGAV